MFKFLTLKDRVLFIRGGNWSLTALSVARKSLKGLGALGLIVLPDDMTVDSLTLDKAIEQLQRMKESQNGQR